MCCVSQTYLDTDCEILRTSVDYSLKTSFIQGVSQQTCQALDGAGNKVDAALPSWSLRSSGDRPNFSFFHLFTHLMPIRLNSVPGPGDRMNQR